MTFRDCRSKIVLHLSGFSDFNVADLPRNPQGPIRTVRISQGPYSPSISSHLWDQDAVTIPSLGCWAACSLVDCHLQAAQIRGDGATMCSIKKVKASTSAGVFLFTC